MGKLTSSFCGYQVLLLFLRPGMEVNVHPCISNLADGSECLNHFLSYFSLTERKSFLLVSSEEDFMPQGWVEDFFCSTRIFNTFEPHFEKLVLEELEYLKKGSLLAFSEKKSKESLVSGFLDYHYFVFEITEANFTNKMQAPWIDNFKKFDFVNDSLLILLLWIRHPKLSPLSLWIQSMSLPCKLTNKRIHSCKSIHVWICTEPWYSCYLYVCTEPYSFSYPYDPLTFG